MKGLQTPSARHTYPPPPAACVAGAAAGGRGYVRCSPAFRAADPCVTLYSRSIPAAGTPDARLQSMSLANLQPFAGQHAIQSAALALDFSSELDIGEVGRLRAAADLMKAEFPNIADQQRAMVQMAVGVGQSGLPTTTMDAGGFVMERRPPSLLPSAIPPQRSIIVNRESVIIVINDYTRWDKFKSDAERYLSSLLSSVNAQKAVASIGLQINDVFLWKADPADLDLAEVFAAKTPYLTPNVFSKDMLLWHSHHGYLKDEKSPAEHKQLTNINVARADVNGSQQLQILTSHKAIFARPLYKFLDANREKIASVLDCLHLENKRILGELLSTALQEKISLNKSKD